jgi:hypothetical protein
MTTEQLAATRRSLHALAERVLAAARFQSVGRIGLQVVDGGIGTPPFGADRRTVALVGGEIVVRTGDGERRAPVGTVRAAADLVGITPGPPAGVYPPANPGRAGRGPAARPGGAAGDRRVVRAG